MTDKKITNIQLRQATKITTSAMAKIWQGEPGSALLEWLYIEFYNQIKFNFC